MSQGKEKCLLQGVGLAPGTSEEEFYSYSSNYFYALVFHWEPQAFCLQGL